jgi:uncharacterized RDD family membrane protein YckC
MNCPRCGQVLPGEGFRGEVCHCFPQPAETAETDGRPISRGVGEKACPEPVEGWGFDSPEEREQAPVSGQSAKTEAPIADPNEIGPTWRDELTSRLSKYRARRKPRPPRYPSLRLRFEAELQQAQPPETKAPGLSAQFATRSDQALALDEMADVRPAVEAGRAQATQPASPADQGNSVPASPRPNPGARIIEFPRSPEFLRSGEVRSAESGSVGFGSVELRPAELRSAPADELAGPVMSAPRILEAPEIVPPPPALGGITMEAAEPNHAHRQPGIDIPLQSASLARRVAAALLDGLIVLLATALFGLIFWKVTGIQPPRYQLLGLAIGIPCVLWAAYQYLLLVYAATTPGLRLAGLALARFDGTFANRRLRRWRVLASYLAAVSLGMGYAWVFLDEDALCWHDRITHTYLAPKNAR